MLPSEFRFYNALGFTLQGDIGPYTMYRSARRKLVIFPKAPPHKPASRLQLWHRMKWTAAARCWKNLCAPHRARWSLAAQRLRLNVSGYNLFLWYCCRKDDALILTIERQTGLDLLPISRAYEA